MNNTEIKEAARKLVAFLNEQGEKKDVFKLDEIDIAAIQENTKKAWTFEVWDKKSPINGRDADFILMHKKKEIPEGGLIYLLKRDGQVVYFQPHNPKESGFVAMTTLDVEKLGMEHLQRVIDEEVVQAVVNLL